jgi:hypothetical protein
MKRIEIINKRFGKLVVREVHSTSRNGHIRYICDCDCGGVTNVLGTHLLQNKTRSCGCLIPKGSEHTKWTGVGEISGNFWNSHILRSANGKKGKRKPLELDITKEFVWDLFLKQERKCVFSGLILKFPERFNDKSYTASLDRIDSSKGYIKGNVQWVHKDINMMKNKLNQDYFIKLCKLVAGDNCEIK